MDALAAFDEAVVGHLAQQLFQRHLVAAGEPERTRDLSLSGLAAMLGDEADNRFPGENPGLGFLLRPARQVGSIPQPAPAALPAASQLLPRPSNARRSCEQEPCGV